ncbi:SIR2 family protein [Janthinobacterium sp. UMAB-60]|uniref:SIR2 family protein n=1 Tax=Janthinobacterium sp. UMAB-60 TaxID=1365365 RepID=UPI001C583A4A|nr:SIR2 family protein [Janthinobacterium sp. UMAB-60]
MLPAEILSELKTTLFAGNYNLLLGTGVSFDSLNRRGTAVQSTQKLTEKLCSLKKVSSQTPLSRISLLLNPAEIKEYLTDEYLGCKPGETVTALTRFLWKTTFTFNIDDALETAYSNNPDRAQSAEPINFDDQYRRAETQSSLHIVHLHGFVREPEKGYVFSVAEYARVTRNQNPWMHILSELIASEPFIIAGTSLNESDLEYYLSGRSTTSPRKNRGPSILVEPFPDAVTDSICERHNLHLVKSTMAQFLQWLNKEVGKPPTISELTLPSDANLFFPKPSNLEQLAFFSSFELVRPLNPSNKDEVMSPFYYGRAASWMDLCNSADVPTQDELRIGAKARNFLESPVGPNKILSLLDEPGSGKSTCIRRIAYNLSLEGRIVFNLKSNSNIQFDSVISCLKFINKPFCLIIDSVADQAAALKPLLDSNDIIKPFVIISADRSYRKDHLDRLLGDLNIEYFSVSNWQPDALSQLIERYRKAGLIGSSLAIHDPTAFTRTLKNDVVAIASCRILNDFRPLEDIVKSIWNHATVATRRTYAIAALANHCYSEGLFYPILEAAQNNEQLEEQFTNTSPLPLAYSYDDDDYVIPLNPVIADRILAVIGREKQTIMLEIFGSLAKALAPYVNRQATIDRTPEAKLAGRLFSAEKVVRPLLGTLADDFYEAAKDSWEWNPRYWEQRALLMQTINLDVAIQFARHAVAIEAHPFPWTTLASLLIKKMEFKSTHRDMLYDEAFELLKMTLKREENHGWRATPHPYVVLFNGTNILITSGGSLSQMRKDFIKKQIEKTIIFFPREKQLIENCDNLLIKIK